MKKRITLIALPSPFLYEPAMNPPIGLCSIGTVVKQAGHDVKIIDFAVLDYDYDSNEYLSEIPTNSDVYGISCVSAQFKYLKQVVRWIRKVNPEALIVSGGPHSSSEPESCLEAGVDIAFNGEGEEGFLEIVENKDPCMVRGACFASPKIFTNHIYSSRRFVEDLNTLPLPDFSLFDMGKYKRKLGGKKAFHIMTLRGCPYNCNFCDSDAIGGKVRYISKERVIEWIDYLIDTYGVRNFVIYDDTFTIKSSRVKYFCEEFKKRNIKWRCWSRANSLREEDLIAMRDSGLESVAIGIESGDAVVLSAINKRTTVEHNREALKLCKKVGVPVRCSLMFGNPGESRESLQNTIDLMEETQPDEWNLSILMPTPGSEFWNNMDKHGLWFDKQKIIDSDYEELNRSGGSAVGHININIWSMPPKEMRKNLDWFVKELERVCPRKKIRDTIQSIKTEAL